jgi:hypothetical protein
VPMRLRVSSNACCAAAARRERVLPGLSFAGGALVISGIASVLSYASGVWVR